MWFARSGPLVGVVLWLCASGVLAQDITPGAAMDRVACAADPAQTYALYVPSNYAPGRAWGLLLAFHPGARGRLMVDAFRAAAEQYGYIVAASNNARNGPMAISMAAAQAVHADVRQRFSIDPRQVYLTGMSGGARVALALALANRDIAGVIAASGGYPDSRPRHAVPFAIFGTAGTEDFNYVEMRRLDRALTSPHFLAVFRGGHGLPPDDVAYDALEWMALGAMQSGRRSRDEAMVGRILEKRRARIAATSAPADLVYQLRALVSDFAGLADVSAESARVASLSRDAATGKALTRERQADAAEERTLQEIFGLEASLADDARRADALLDLGRRLAVLSREGARDAWTPDRDRARRLLQSVTFGASERVQDPGYLRLLERYRPPKRGW